MPCCDSECRFEATNPDIPITFECGAASVVAYWHLVPRTGDFVTVKSRQKGDDTAISGVVSAAAWAEDEYGNPEVTLTVAVNPSSLTLAGPQTNREVSTDGK